MSGLGGGQCPGESHGYNASVERVVHVPYTVEQDETGWWCAHAPLPGGGANGEGQTPEEAVADLRQALDGWFAELRYFIECVERREKPSVVTARDANRSIRIVEAERQSILMGGAVDIL